MATDNGLSFLEFNYMLMQSYDFLELFKNYGCTAGDGRQRPVERTCSAARI